jgi:hypothetical protein
MKYERRNLVSMVRVAIWKMRGPQNGESNTRVSNVKRYRDGDNNF